MHAISILQHLLYDTRFALRRLGRTPGWTLLCSGTLAAGLAAAIVTTVLVRDVLLRPLPFREQSRLVRIVEISENGRRWWPSFPNALDWRERGRMFDGVAIADIPRVEPVLLDSTAARVTISRAGRGMFETLGVEPVAGRLFTPDEHRPGSAPAALVTERFWRRELRAAAPGDVSVTIGRERYTVVGVLPAGFRFLGQAAAWTEPAEIWTPMERDTNLGSRTTHGIHVVGRLKEGLSLEQARREMNQLASSLKDEHREPTQADAALLTPLHEIAVGSAREPLNALLYAAAAVLLVSCLNLAGAILAQGLGRGRELSVRLALGATRTTLARHLLAEAATLALPGTVLGVTLAAIGMRVITTAASGALPRLDEASLDWQAVTVAFGLAVAVASIAGLIPAFLLSRPAVAERLRTHATSTGRSERRRLWQSLVAAEVALTTVLLAGTGLLIRSFTAALTVDVGYDARNLLAVDVTLPDARYSDPSRRLTYYDAALARLRSTAGVRAAGLTSALPHDWSTFTSGATRDGESHTVMAATRLVDPGFFEAAGIPRLVGDPRSLERDSAVIDRRLARALWRDGSPIGDRVITSFAGDPIAVAGIVGTVREWNQADDETMGVVYVDFHRQPHRTQMMHFVVRFDGIEELAAPAVRQALAAVDPMVPVTIESVESRAMESLRGRRLQLLLAGGFGLVALVLAAAGVYGMVAFTVGRQMRETAIRLALGARPGDLRRRIVMQGVIPAAAGVVGGLVMLLPATAVLRSQLFHARPFDPAVLFPTAAALVIAAVAAAAVPAHRAVRVDPASIFRDS